jgi:hypothetical protein
MRLRSGFGKCKPQWKNSLSFLDNPQHFRKVVPAAMAKRKLASERARRLEVRARILQGAGRVFFMITCLAVGFVVVSTAVPQKRRLEALEGKLEQAKERERKTLAEREYYEIEHQALRTDPEFLEIHARDRLDYYREGEKVLKFRSGK